MSKRRNGESAEKMQFYAEKLKKYQKLLDEVKDLSDEKDSDVESHIGKGSDNDDLESLSSNGEVNSQTTSRELQETKVDVEEPPTQLSEKASLLLGVAKRQLKDQTFNFHPELAACWNEILDSGLDAKIKKSFEETYPNKGDCSLIAPELNPELLPFLHKTAKSRDKYLVSSQGSLWPRFSRTRKIYLCNFR
ncbi:Protein of unknown function [Cotesia congregata]|uniref:Uncharacterized protein n=1 Tax=Cotesia congregata TaxID=51543 RepID=A0A8J2ECF9_COTCN|nr:Protein of unknown function [Cotesia congregata]